jgi:hypothetical protein
MHGGVDMCSARGLNKFLAPGGCLVVHTCCKLLPLPLRDIVDQEHSVQRRPSIPHSSVLISQQVLWPTKTYFRISEACKMKLNRYGLQRRGCLVRYSQNLSLKVPSSGEKSLDTRLMIVW